MSIWRINTNLGCDAFVSMPEARGRTRHGVANHFLSRCLAHAAATIGALACYGDDLACLEADLVHPTLKQCHWRPMAVAFADRHLIAAENLLGNIPRATGGAQPILGAMAERI